jgi:hypothetical protein
MSSGADGVGWWKEQRHSSHTKARSAGFKKVPRAASHIREKKRGKNKPTARYLIDQYGERGKAIKKNVFNTRK